MEPKLRLIVPKGRIQEKVARLLERIGMGLAGDGRSYRPVCRDPEAEVKLLKPQNIPRLVELGRHDAGFTGYDWVVEQGAEVVELVDLGYDPVRIVAAVPEELAGPGRLAGRRLVVASEYVRMAREYGEGRGLDAVLVQTYGATEALPPEDADMIVDNMSTGATLRTNRLAVVDELMRSTTRFVCDPKALDVPAKRDKLERMAMLVRGVLEADSRVLLEMNVPKSCLARVVEGLPCMRAPTVSPLLGEEGCAVKVAVPASAVPELLPWLAARGARDILEYRMEKIIAGEEARYAETERERGEGGAVFAAS